MNELIFFFHLLSVLAGCRLALYFGRDGLLTWVIIQPLLANLFVLKTTTLFGLEVTCSDVYAVGAILGLNLLQEYYGKQTAKLGSWLCFYSLIFFVFMSLIHLLYLPSDQDTMHTAYQMIFSPAPRLVVASIFTFFIVQQIDRRVFGFLKTQFSQKSLLFRNLTSLSLSQLLDTFLFTALGLWGLVAKPLEVFFLSFLIKLIIATILALLTPRTHVDATVSI